MKFIKSIIEIDFSLLRASKRPSKLIILEVQAGQGSNDQLPIQEAVC